MEFDAWHRFQREERNTQNKKVRLNILSKSLNTMNAGQRSHKCAGHAVIKVFHFNECVQILVRYEIISATQLRERLFLNLALPVGLEYNTCVNKAF